jgi:AcrR family transcriptional regulator
MSRAETEQQLEAAAIELLRRDGVLSGMSLREVADNAGVNRGLVYHYFGSRQALLRSALQRDAGDRLEQIRSSGTLPFPERVLRYLHLVIDQRDAVLLRTLLVLDGDVGLELMPLKEEVDARIAAEQAAGELDADLDVEAVHALIVSMTWGYVLFREMLAAEYGRPVGDLDEHIGDLMSRMLRSLNPDAETS